MTRSSLALFALLGAATAHLDGLCTCTDKNAPGDITFYLATYHSPPGANSKVPGSVHIRAPDTTSYTFDFDNFVAGAAQPSGTTSRPGMNGAQFAQHVKDSVSAPASTECQCYGGDPDMFGVTQPMKADSHNGCTNPRVLTYYMATLSNAKSGTYVVHTTGTDMNLDPDWTKGMCAFTKDAPLVLGLSIADGGNNCANKPTFTDGSASDACDNAISGLLCSPECGVGKFKVDDAMCTDGQWVGSLRCVDEQPCTTDKLGVSGMGVDGCGFATKSGDSCTLKCGTGTTIQGDAQATCQDGTWALADANVKCVCTLPYQKATFDGCTDFGGKCANGVLRALTDRTADNQCASCDAGYGMEADGRCAAFHGHCINGELVAKQADRTQHNQCGSCKPGFSLTQDHSCAPQFGGTCEHGQLAAQQDRTQHNHCASCDFGYKLDLHDRTCHAADWAESVDKTPMVGLDSCSGEFPNFCLLSENGQIEPKPAVVSAANIAQHEADSCTCEDKCGKPCAVSGVHCGFGDAKCVESCEAGFYEVQVDASLKRCQPNVCTCSGGTGSTGAACTTHDDHHCVSCNAGYHMANGKCEQNECVCQYGERTENVECSVHGAQGCGSCNTGYDLVNGACVEQTTTTTTTTTTPTTTTTTTTATRHCIKHTGSRRKYYGSSTELNLANVAYGSVQTEGACFAACKADANCMQAVFHSSGGCYPMNNAAADDEDGSLDGWSTYVCLPASAGSCGTLDNVRSAHVTGGHLDLATVSYGGQSTFENCRDECQANPKCLQAVWATTGHCWPMKTASSVRLDHASNTWKTAQCQKAARTRTVTASELANAQCTKGTGTVTMDVSSNKWEFHGIPEDHIASAAWYCDVTTTDEFIAVDASYRLTSVDPKTSAVQDPDDNAAMTSWGADTGPNHSGYFSFGTPTTVLDAGGTRGGNLGYQTPNNQVDVTFQGGSVSKTNVVRFGFSQSANHEDFSIDNVVINLIIADDFDSYDGYACAGRNELPSQRNIDVATALQCSFVFTMLSKHCTEISPELEHAYLDPFVMMLTACAVPVIMRVGGGGSAKPLTMLKVKNGAAHHSIEIAPVLQATPDVNRIFGRAARAHLAPSDALSAELRAPLSNRRGMPPPQAADENRAAAAASVDSVAFEDGIDLVASEIDSVASEAVSQVEAERNEFLRELDADGEEDASAIFSRLPEFDFSFRFYFAWPSRLSFDVQIVLGVSIGSLGVQYLLLAFRKAWVAGLGQWGQSVAFAFEAVEIGAGPTHKTGALALVWRRRKVGLKKKSYALEVVLKALEALTERTANVETLDDQAWAKLQRKGRLLRAQLTLWAAFAAYRKAPKWADVFRKCRSLISVNLNNNNIGVEGGKAIAKVLPKCPLKVLELALNNIGAEGAKALAAVLSSSPLISVNLLKNDLGDGLEALSAAFEKSSTLKSLCGL
eukprot:g3087.t1